MFMCVGYVFVGGRLMEVFMLDLLLILWCCDFGLGVMLVVGVGLFVCGEGGDKGGFVMVKVL